MNELLAKLLDPSMGAQQPQPAPGMPPEDPRIQGLVQKGMTPEQAKQVLMKSDALLQASQRPNPGSAFPQRVPTAVIGVRG